MVLFKNINQMLFFEKLNIDARCMFDTHMYIGILFQAGIWKGCSHNGRRQSGGSSKERSNICEEYNYQQREWHLPLNQIKFKMTP